MRAAAVVFLALSACNDRSFAGGEQVRDMCRSRDGCNAAIAELEAEPCGPFQRMSCGDRANNLRLASEILVTRDAEWLKALRWGLEGHDLKPHDAGSLFERRAR